MKHIARLLAVLMVAGLFAAAFAVTPAALSSEDWVMVNHPSGSPANAQISTTSDGGIRLAHEGHYPSSNAGLMYSKPVDLKDGVSLNVTVETDNSASSDVWYGIMFLDKAVYFDAMTGGNSDEDAHGIIALTRPGSFAWWTFPGFNNVATTSFSDMDTDKEYYGEGINTTYELKEEDGSLFIYVDDYKIDFDFKDSLPYFAEGVYVGFSMSMTELEYQSFVINYLNGEKPASEGPEMTADGPGSTPATEEPFIPEGAKSFVLCDFTDPEYVGSLTGNDCKISFDETENAMKVEITGSDPYVNIPMKKNMFFDGYDYTVARLTYKTDVDCIGEFYFTTKEVPSMALCNVTYGVDATNGEWSEIVQDMDDSANWMGEVRSFRIDPNQAGEEGEVFYYKTLSMEIYEEPETEPKPVTTSADTEPDTTAADNGEATADNPGKDVTTDNGGSTPSKGGVPAWVWIVVGVVAVAAIAAVIAIVAKKKKK